MLLRGPYFPSHNISKLSGEGDVTAARRLYFNERPQNLVFLLTNRYCWMNKYLDGLDMVIELGAGSGLSKEFINNPNYMLTDYQKKPWIDRKIDALSPQFEDESVDAVVCSHMIHHLARPAVFFNQMSRILKPGGYLLIQDVHNSLLLRLLLRILHHEGWSYEIDVFDDEDVVNNPSDPWSGNNAVPDLFFLNSQKFADEFTNLKILNIEMCECFIIPIAGGVIVKRKTIQLPKWGLKIVGMIDNLLVKLLPSLLALGQRVVIQKV